MHRCSYSTKSNSLISLTGRLRIYELHFITFGLKVQCDQIGLFLKGLVDKFSYKSSPNLWTEQPNVLGNSLTHKVTEQLNVFRNA